MAGTQQEDGSTKSSSQSSLPRDRNVRRSFKVSAGLNAEQASELFTGGDEQGIVDGGPRGTFFYDAFEVGEVTPQQPLRADEGGVPGELSTAMFSAGQSGMGPRV